ncbi:hypothetical protein [Aromatoleum diolicum]|uniref:Lipoprotein n=1 Tax=Aromatoleum diolicum TaxID=75796 RepID=A0ABX1QD45_9RHOO|nr:hypothetical protein [Aromatoleum diolicum]NMG76326.1 hypothetical protein [Aromatoleum diolicum]
MSLLFAGCATSITEPGAVPKIERFAYRGGGLVLRQADGECRIVAAGEISPAMVSSLTLVMREVEKQRACSKKWLELNITDGLLGQAITAGSMLRNRGYSTRLQPGSVCHTPCLLVFAAGVQRVIPSDSLLVRLGFSQIPPDEDFGGRHCETELNNNQQLTLARYLRAMLAASTADRMFRMINEANCQEVHELPVRDALTMGLATGG